MSEPKSDATEVPSEAFLSGFNAGRNGTKDYDVHQAWATYLRFGGQRTNSAQTSGAREGSSAVGAAESPGAKPTTPAGGPGEAGTYLEVVHGDVRGSGAAGRGDATPVASVGADGGAGAGPHHAGDAAWEAGAAGGAGVGGGDPVATFDAWAKGRTFVDEERTTSATVVTQDFSVAAALGGATASKLVPPGVTVRWDHGDTCRCPACTAQTKALADLRASEANPGEIACAVGDCKAKATHCLMACEEHFPKPGTDYPTRAIEALQRWHDRLRQAPIDVDWREVDAVRFEIEACLETEAEQKRGDGHG